MGWDIVCIFSETLI